MDKELETYVDVVLEQQNYRNGIFATLGQIVSALTTWYVSGVGLYRGSIDERQAHVYKAGGWSWMDLWLETYVQQVMDKQPKTDGIDLMPRLTNLLRKLGLAKKAANVAWIGFTAHVFSVISEIILLCEWILSLKYHYPNQWSDQWSDLVF